MKLRPSLILALSILGALALSATASAATSRLAYVANFKAESVSVLDTSTMEEVGEPIPVAVEPAALAVSPDGKRVYVVSEATGELETIDTATDEVIGTPLDLGFSAAEIAITPDGTKAFVTDESQDRIDVIKLADEAVIDEIEVPDAHFWGAAVSPDGRFLYAVDQGDAKVYVFDATDSDEQIGEPIEVGDQPVNIVFTPNGKTAYVDNGASGDVSVIDVASRRVVGTIAVGESPWGMALTPDGSKLFVANEEEGTVTVVDTAAGEQIGEPIEVGSEPFEIAITPNGKRALVADYASEDVTAIDTTSDEVVGEPTDFEHLGPWLVVVAPDESPSGAAFSASTALAGSPTQFTGSAGGVDPDGFITGYDWSFGDGGTASTAAPKVSHTYASVGSFAATLEPIDDEGCGSSQLWTGRGGYCTGSAAATGTALVSQPPALPIAKAPSNLLRLGKLKLNRKKGTATLQVVLPSAGKLTLNSRKVRAVNRKGGPGNVTLALRPKAKTTKLLKEKGKAKVKIKVTFVPTGGSSRSASRSLTLVRNGK